ncbi:MAG: hypothetical protein WA667_16210 [Candidatus Nitrosopolaris sp.]
MTAVFPTFRITCMYTHYTYIHDTYTTTKIFGIMNTEITNYLALWFDPSDSRSFQDGRRTLISIEGGSVKVEMSKTRGRCSKITNIYNKFLNPWFMRILDSDEQRMMSQLFRQLDEFDGVMVRAIEELTDWLTTKARETLDLVNGGKCQEANEFIKVKRKEIQPTRVMISERIQDLYRLQADFINIS